MEPFAKIISDQKSLIMGKGKVWTETFSVAIELECSIKKN